jgi:hypothetical protein
MQYFLNKTGKYMNNLLTLDQQNRLISASSKMSREEWGKLPVGITDQIAARIDRVILELHEENPMAFSTIAYYDEALSKVVYTKKSVGMDFYRYGQRR